MGRPLNDGVTPVLAAVHRSSTSRGHAARETQIIIVLARRLLVGERLVTVVDKPGQHLRSQVPQMPISHEEGAFTPAARTASSTVCSDATSTTRPVRELHL